MDEFAAPRARLGLAALVLGSRAGGAKLQPTLIAAARSRVTTTQRRAQNIAEDDAVTCISQTRCVTAAEDPQQPIRRPVVVRGGAGRVSFIVEDIGRIAGAWITLSWAVEPSFCFGTYYCRQ